MNFQGLNFHLSVAALVTLVGCASTSPAPTPEELPEQTTQAPYVAPTEARSTHDEIPAGVARELPGRKPTVDNNGLLICKASRKRIHYDWSAGSAATGQGMIDQNNIRYEFRSAKRPAGARGEHLKVGECGWASEALPTETPQKQKGRSQILFKSLSDEATQTFYKMKTGKVFKVPVRQTKNGLVAAPGGVSVIR